MSDYTDLARKLLTPPGMTIKETIEFSGMTQVELAERLGRSKEKINELLNGRENISTDTAFRLEKVLGIPAHYWMNMESLYRQELYKIEQRESYESSVDWLSEFPIRKMKGFGWIENTTDKTTLVSSLLTYFGVATIKEWQLMYNKQSPEVSFRISTVSKKNPYAIVAWLRQGEIEALEATDLPTYNKSAFRSVLEAIKELAFNHPDDFAEQLKSFCASVGVVLVYTPNLPNAPISGAARWLYGRPVIQLSGRFRTDDHFWFTFFHEAGHILLHNKKDVFLEGLGGHIDEEKENEANRFSAKQLIKESEIKRLLSIGWPTAENIEQFSKEVMVPTGVIVGRLQHMKEIKRSVHNQLKRKISLFD